MATMVVSAQTHTGTVELPFDFLAFSAMRCFTQAERCGTAPELYAAIARTLCNEPEIIALYGMGPFLDALLDASPELIGKVGAIIDPSASCASYRGIPLVAHWSSLPGNIHTVFICRLQTEIRWRLRRSMEPGLKVLCPGLLAQSPALVSPEAWVILGQHIYPACIPGLEIDDDLDLVLLDLPARNNFAFPLSMGYVHKALKKIAGLKFRTVDGDAILYHRYHIRRLFDLGEPVVLENGRTLDIDPWDWREECWMDPRLWSQLQALFADDIKELITNLIAARPRILAMTVHQRNEWITRLVARDVKAALPDTIILVGGHSCVSHTFGPKAFPEYDYMVIGEAESVIGPLLQLLLTGAQPKDLPGVVSRHDSPDRLFTPSIPPENLDEIGPPEYDWAPGFQLFRKFQGDTLPYMNLTRGCIWARCSFCSERFHFRTRSAERFVDELESYCKAGLTYVNFSESDFGGKTEILSAVADEILRRGLRIRMAGQLRINSNHDLPLLRKLVAAGIDCNYGIDGLTPHTLKLQRKGYSLDTALETLRNCKEAGIKVFVNLVVGVPGETDQDVDDTIQFILDNRHMIFEVFNISPFYLAHGNSYWDEPGKHGIRFLEDRETLYAKYFHGIPSHYWYSVDPFIDCAVRRKRAHKIFSVLRQSGVPVDEFAENNIMRPMFEGFQNPRDLLAEFPSLAYRNPGKDSTTALPRQFINYLQNRVMVKVSDLVLAVRETDLPILQGSGRIISIQP
jgi:hypothetical protein